VTDAAVYRYPFGVIDRAAGIFASVCPLMTTHFSADGRRVGLQSDLEKVIEAIHAGRGSGPITVFCLVWWSVEAEAGQLLRQLRVLRRRFPDTTVVILCNSPAEEALLATLGVPAVVCNHNAFITPDLFVPRQVEPEWTAVHNGALAPYKRHELAQKIASLAVLTYSRGEYPRYVEQMRRLLGHAAWVNAQHDGSFEWLSSTAVAAVLNRCRVGLCLSEREGAMYASFEYLLMGLPVVSTPSLGGRDVFFDPDFSEIVAPDPDAVSDAAERWARRNPPRDEIRARALALRREHLERFTSVLGEHLRRLGRGSEAAEGITAALPNRLVAWQAPADITAAARMPG
jgi:glycosyltransferase involved in cell wall biosynthesis